MENNTEVSEEDIKRWIEFIEGMLISEENQIPQSVVLTLMSIIFFVGLIGNLLTCIVIYYDRTMHTATNYYLFNLAVSDLLVSFAILLEIFEYIDPSYHYPQYKFGDLSCKIHFFLVIALWNNGVLIMTALAVERYVAICHPLMLKSTPMWRRVTKVIVIIWIVAIAESLPEVWTLQLIQTRKASMCFIVPSHFAKILNGVLAVVTFLIPLGIMTFVYAMIAFQMKVTQKGTSKGRIFNQRNNRSKVNKLITLTLSFLVCWVPFFTMRILISIWDAKQLMGLSKWWTVWCKVCSLNNWFSGVLNPLMFSLMSTKFRQSLKALWNRKINGQQPELYTSRATVHL